MSVTPPPSNEPVHGVLERLETGMMIPYGGNKWVRVSDSLASTFRAGDRLIVVQDDGTLIHVPAAVGAAVELAVGRARAAFDVVRGVDQERVTAFYASFAERLADDEVFARVAEANERDVRRARENGRATGRLALDEKMRRGMIESLGMWRRMEGTNGRVVERVDHGTWTVEAFSAPLGVVAFVFEGRPNVFADATGVLRGGNSTVMRIGSDALGTARAIMDSALRPALLEAGLPEGAVELVDQTDRAAGHALFSDKRISLAVARGSGTAVAQLGAVARQSGVPVSLHGTGGAWMIVDPRVSPQRVRDCVCASLDRKVCNTVNVVAVIGDDRSVIAGVLDGVVSAAEHRGVRARVHFLGDEARLIGADDDRVDASFGPASESSIEWEWDDVPEVSVMIVDDVDEAIEAFNTHSPRFIVSALSDDHEMVARVHERCDAPFVGDGFTRWVDGQYALSRPELGLSNWEGGRLFARGGILSGDGVHSVRHRAHTPDPTQRR